MSPDTLAWGIIMPLSVSRMPMEPKSMSLSRTKLTLVSGMEG